MDIGSDFAILDVTKGRRELMKHVNNKGYIDVVIRGRIETAWGDDDGISREFSVDVKSVEVTAVVE